MNTVRLRHRAAILVPFCYVLFLLFGVIGVFTSGDVGYAIIAMTALTWILSKMIGEAWNSVLMWRRMNEDDTE